MVFTWFGNLPTSMELQGFQYSQGKIQSAAIQLWEPKMCRLAWQLLGMLGNVLGLLDMLRNVLGMLYRSLVVHYSLGFTAYKAASGGVYLRCGTPRTLRKGMPRRPRTLPSMPRSCQASLHILGSHNYYCISKIFKLDKILIYLWGKKSSSHQLYI